MSVPDNVQFEECDNFIGDKFSSAFLNSLINALREVPEGATEYIEVFELLSIVVPPACLSFHNY
jgi:hypothetical protein